MHISVVNLVPNRLGTEELLQAIAAINRQLTEHVFPYWHLVGRVRLDHAFVGRDVEQLTGMRGDAVLYISDEPSRRVLGLHEKHRNGTPMGFVFLDVCEQLNQPWSVALSHELIEMLADPMCNLVCRGPHPEEAGRYVFHWFELCDPVQGDMYEIDGFRVSNFVLPAFFTGGDDFEGRNDYMGAHKGRLRSFSVNPRGYIGYFDPELKAHRRFSHRDAGSVGLLDEKDAVPNLAPFRRNGRRRGDGPTTTVNLMEDGTFASRRRNPSGVVAAEGIYFSVPEGEEALETAYDIARPTLDALSDVSLLPLAAANNGDFIIAGPGVERFTLAELWPVVRDLRQRNAGRDTDLLYEAVFEAVEDTSTFASGGSDTTCPCDGLHDPDTDDDPAWALKVAKIDRAREVVAEKNHGGDAEKVGSGIVIAHPDTGYTRYLAGKVKGGGIDFVRPGGGEPIDPLPKKTRLTHPGHGTRTGATLVSSERDEDGDNIEGAAPGAELLPFRIGKSVIQVGGCNLARAVEAATRLGAHVVSMSIGGTGGSYLRKQIRRAYNNNLILVAAAGNCVKAVVQPARHRHVISCAAIDIEEKPWCGSSRSSVFSPRKLVDIAAPGDSVWTMDVSLLGPTLGRPFEGRRRGTSYAATAVAGAAALWLDFHGREKLLVDCDLLGVRLTDLFRYVLQKSAHQPQNWDDRYGVGILDARKLLDIELPKTLGLAMAFESTATERLAELFPELERADFESRLRGVLGLSAGAPMEHFIEAFEAELEPVLRFDAATRRAFEGVGHAMLGAGHPVGPLATLAMLSSGAIEALDGDDPQDGELGRLLFNAAVADGVEEDEEDEEDDELVLAADAVPPDFPNVPNTRGDAKLRNWAKNWKYQPSIATRPQNQEQLLAVINWAAANEWKVRPVGKLHNWSALVFPATAGASVAIEMTELADITVQGARVTFGAGATLEAVMEALEDRGRSLPSIPAPGQMTMGGILAIGGHGTGIDQTDEPGLFGSLSNLIVNMTVVAKVGATYELRSFERGTDPKMIAALSCHLGNVFVVEATLETVRRYSLDTRSSYPHPDIAFSSGDEFDYQQFAELARAHGRVEAIWFMTNKASQEPRVWMKVWDKPDTWPIKKLRRAKKPYPYRWARIKPVQRPLVNSWAKKAKRADRLANFALKTTLENEPTRLTRRGLAKNLLLYVERQTIEYTALGYAVHCHQETLQDVVHAVYQIVRDHRRQYSKKTRPNNGPLELRVTMTDEPRNAGARSPILSPARPMRPGDDMVLWLNLFSKKLPNTWEYFSNVERALWDRFEGRLRPEWSKAWAIDKDGGPWKNEKIIARLPALFPADEANVSVGSARNVFRQLDPEGLFAGRGFEYLGD